MTVAVLPDAEQQRLGALEYPQVESPWERAVRRAAVRVLRGLLPPRPAVLELGCADGYMTALLAPHVRRHVVVDGDPEFLEETRGRVPGSVELVESLFEDYEPDEDFDVVVASFILEHIHDPAALLRRARGWLRPEGRLFVVVPNGRALSRQLARAMGLVGELRELTPNDHAHGHRRCYDRVTLDRDLALAGAEVLQRGGLMVKPLANFQMDQLIEMGVLGPEQLEGLERLGGEHPDLTAALYAVAR